MAHLLLPAGLSPAALAPVSLAHALLFWCPLRARLHIVPKPWTRTGRTARSALLAPFAPANVGGYDRKQLTASGGVACPSMAPMRKPIRHARSIGLYRFPALRFHPDLVHRGDNGIHRLPALVAAVTGNDGAVEGVQRIWLDPKRPAKGPISLRPRKAFGRVYGRAVRFGGSSSGAPLPAGKGIETVLSLVTAVDRNLAESALSAGTHGDFEPPQDLSLLVIARDKDMADEHAANRLQRRCVERGIPSIVIVPEPSDFSDDLIAFGETTLAARIAPLIASTQPAATVEGRCGSGRIISPS